MQVINFITRSTFTFNSKGGIIVFNGTLTIALIQTEKWFVESLLLHFSFVCCCNK